MDPKFINWLENQVYVLNIVAKGEWMISDGTYDPNWNWNWKEILEWDE